MQNFWGKLLTPNNIPLSLLLSAMHYKLNCFPRYCHHSHRSYHRNHPSHESISPTAAGMNIIGIISIKKMLVSLISATLMILHSRHANKITIPYMLAGTGNGRNSWSSSPINDINNIIPNCFSNFNFYLHPLSTRRIFSMDLPFASSSTILSRRRISCISGSSISSTRTPHTTPFTKVLFSFICGAFRKKSP